MTRLKFDFWNCCPSARRYKTNCDVFLHIDVNPENPHLQYRQDRRCKYNVTSRRVRAATVAVEKQYVLYILSVCL